ncbi:hypothetical protein BKA62DRAFT_773147 [Auriculariales sp. MPI-PUGE-AT-0066]|nr:hypothetical protein BKA62DRAFT_773147 [Auriculariales sp. MPI-PUGE-AT-0066]
MPGPATFIAATVTRSSATLQEGYFIVGLQFSPINALAILLGTTCATSTLYCQNIATSGLINVQGLAITL